MRSKGRIPLPHMRHSLPGTGMGSHPDQPPMRAPPPGAFPLYDMLPPPEVMEQKLIAEQVEMQKVATENYRIAATHGTLRQELAASQHELQTLNAQIDAMNSDANQQIRSMTDTIARMEADLKASEPLKSELQKAHMEAQKLDASRHELIAEVQILSRDLHRAHVNVQQIPALMSELDGLRHEYQRRRAMYDYEKKLYNDHLESLQVMEKNFMIMAREIEKLRGELMNPVYADRRPVAPFGVGPGGNENEASGHPVGHNSHEDGYNALQGRAPLPPPSGSAVSSAPVAAGTSVYAGAQTGSDPARPGYDPAAGSATYDPQRGHGGYAPDLWSA